MAKAIRVALLLFVLASVAVGAWRKRDLIQTWERTLDVVVYPINGDGRDATAAYVASLSSQSFVSIGEFMRFWAWRNDDYAGPNPDVRVFAVYFDPAARQRVEHSIGTGSAIRSQAVRTAINSQENSGWRVTAREPIIAAHYPIL